MIIIFLLVQSLGFLLTVIVLVVVLKHVSMEPLIMLGFLAFLFLLSLFLALSLFMFIPSMYYRRVTSWKVQTTPKILLMVLKPPLVVPSFLRLPCVFSLVMYRRYITQKTISFHNYVLLESNNVKKNHSRYKRPQIR